MGVYRQFSEINNEPVKKVKASVVMKDGAYRLCVEGKLRKNGFGEYQIYIPQEQASHTGFRCRNDKLEKYGGRYYCSEYTIPVMHAKSEDVLWGCPTTDENPASKYSAVITGKDSRTLILKDSQNLDVAEIYITEVWEGTNPVAYLFMPFTVAFDLVTSPIQIWFGLAMGNR
jgi:hypothetical protein